MRMQRSMVQLSISKGTGIALCAWLGASLSALMVAIPAHAQSAAGPAAIGTVDDKALTLAMAVRSRALSSSFDALDAFAEEAMARDDVEGLSRLQYVVTSMIQQREYQRAAGWNTQLALGAKQLRRAEYDDASQINSLLIRNYSGQRISDEELNALVQGRKHWLSLAIARAAQARLLVERQRAAEAIAVLAQAIPDIPDGQEQVAGIAGILWDHVAMAHGGVDDLPGFITAVEHAERYKTASPYPQPDFEAIYMMVQSLGFIGRYDEAQGGAVIYQELADRAGTPMLRGMAASLCGYASAVRENWSGVLACYSKFSPDLNLPNPARRLMLARRSIAYSRTGQVALAKRDLDEIDRMVAAGTVRSWPLLQSARAEYLIASGDHRAGVPMLRDFHLTQLRRTAQASAATMEQVMVSMDDKLKQAEEQTLLKNLTISSQRWLIGLGGVLGFVFGVMFFRQRSLVRILAAINAAQREEHNRQSEFFANISHEIRTPLNGVVAMADAIRHTPLTPEAADMVGIIATSSNSLERLLSDFLDHAKMGAGQVSIDPAPMELSKVLADVKALWTPKAVEKGVRIVTYLEGQGPVWVMGDAGRLTQVLNNLISNAIKFTDAGKIAISIVAQKGDRYVFAVTDNGVGFDNAVKDRLFERFQQADSSVTRRYGGTGLGLPISRQLVELMGGELDCESEIGRGTQFWFEVHLPKATVPVEYVHAGEEVPMVSGASRVLIVDDNATNRTILSMLLKDPSRQLYFAENGLEAVEMAARIPFDVILMDVQMPVMSGIDAIRAIRKAEREAGVLPVTIVILSANADSHHQREGAEAGADGHIAKPVVLERLLAGIDMASQKRAALNARDEAIAS